MNPFATLRSRGATTARCSSVNYWQYLGYHQNLHSAAPNGPPSRSFATLRRPRVLKTKIDAISLDVPDTFRRPDPYEHGESSTEEYLKKTSLSPWVPVPDTIARKALDMTDAGPDDIHVDLGSGDGRVCFHAIDTYLVKKSIGIDVDENIVAVAEERRTKRHPPPKHVQFLVADLLDKNHAAWEIVQEATIITMYFAEEALKLLRPVLEEKLVGKKCKIVTAGYEMPGWRSRQEDVVLGTAVHYYEWGSETMEELVEGADLFGMDEEEVDRLYAKNNPQKTFAGKNVKDNDWHYDIDDFKDLDEMWFDDGSSDEDDDDEKEGDQASDKSKKDPKKKKDTVARTQ